MRTSAGRITDRESFHRVLRQAMGFPGSYGGRMGAWIDDTSHPGLLTCAPVESGDVLAIEATRWIPQPSRTGEGVPSLLALVFARDRLISRPTDADA